MCKTLGLKGLKGHSSTDYPHSTTMPAASTTTGMSGMLVVSLRITVPTTTGPDASVPITPASTGTGAPRPRLPRSIKGLAKHSISWLERFHLANGECPISHHNGPTAHHSCTEVRRKVLQQLALHVRHSRRNVRRINKRGSNTWSVPRTSASAAKRLRGSTDSSSGPVVAWC